MKISEIELHGSLFFKLFAIQSIRQLVSYIFFTLIGFMVFQFGLTLFGANMAAPITLLCAFFGSSVILRMVLPATFYIENDSSEECLRVGKFLEEKIEKQSYINVLRSYSDSIFQSKLPMPLKWKENEISINKTDMDLTVKGPVFIIRMLHKNLKNMMDDC